ncbi:hypothetical protein K488DRAFT_70243 [Vararia minispora EC-137]|uniref:Uncharacterized protein n=1 Tax=Vararia minispora EC-137 TaxID=1314806 RepID=A0ACB8QMC4_9AGAM|nr:hypothetical protein K488DRAFT_70243 [Vararia minispora EC-137]
MHSRILLAILAYASAAAAQYFDDGWRPGQPFQQPLTQQAQFQPRGAPPPPAAPTHSLPSLSSLSDMFSLENVLASKPSQELFRAFGINITERLANATKAMQIWDERIPLITDDSYGDMIVNEELSPEEEEKRVWFLIITVSMSQQNGISQFADKQFDEAFNLTVVEDDLPDVRWGRIDYINVTTITTKWGVWSAPMLVVLKDRGQTLRFYRATQIRLRPDALREFLRTELWQRTKPWSSAFAPGGKREFVMDWLALALTKNYEFMRVMPRWLLYIITGMVGSVVINFLHRGDGSQKESKKPRQRWQNQRQREQVQVSPRARVAQRQ